jgi:PPOX class probable F420-dependent enzyme
VVLAGAIRSIVSAYARCQLLRGDSFHGGIDITMAFQLDQNDPKQAHIAERLRNELILWLASVRPDGRPHLVPVWFLWEGETILIFSKPKNQKLSNVTANPAVTVALDSADDGDDIVVLEGVAALVNDPAASTTLAAYATKYTGRLADMGWTPESMAKEYTEAIRITPTRILVSF